MFFGNEICRVNFAAIFLRSLYTLCLLSPSKSFPRLKTTAHSMAVRARNWILLVAWIWLVSFLNVPGYSWHFEVNATGQGILLFWQRQTGKLFFPLWKEFSFLSWWYKMTWVKTWSRAIVNPPPHPPTFDHKFSCNFLTHYLAIVLAKQLHVAIFGIENWQWEKVKKLATKLWTKMPEYST